MKKVKLSEILDLEKLKDPNLELSSEEVYLIVYDKDCGGNIMNKEPIILSQEELDNQVRDIIKSKRNFNLYNIKCEAFEISKK